MQWDLFEALAIKYPHAEWQGNSASREKGRRLHSEIYNVIH